MTFRIETTAGPDTGQASDLTAGRHLLGRSRQCEHVIHDGAVEAHHVLLDVASCGTITATQLAGRRPIAVDGTAGDGLLRAVLEVGDTRLELSGEPAVVDEPPGVVDVDVTVPADTADLAGALAAASLRRRAGHLHEWRSGSVSLGVGAMRLALRLVDGSGAGIDPASLPIELQRLVLAAEWHAGVPILLDGNHRPVIAVVDHDPGSRRGEAVAHWLTSRLTAPGHSVPTLLTADDPVPAHCTSLLEVGPRWRGRWTPDLTRPEASVRLHLAGRSVAGGDRRPLLAEQVPRTVTEVAGDVTGVPQPARRQ